MNSISEKNLLSVYSLYDKLISPIDRVWSSFLGKYGDHVSCRPGCSLCCEKGLTFFPVEVFYAAYHISRNRVLLSELIRNNHREKDRCIFLRENKCFIYPFRPMLCRTFGLPVMYLDGESYLFDICGKNLEGMVIEELDLKCVLNMDALNQKLVNINRLFSEMMGIDKSARYTAQKVLELLQDTGSHK